MISGFPDGMNINLSCHDRAVIAGVTSFRRGSTALMLFESPSSEGRVVWQQEIERSQNAREEGIGIIAATPEMIIYELWLPGRASASNLMGVRLDLRRGCPLEGGA